MGERGPNHHPSRYGPRPIPVPGIPRPHNPLQINSSLSIQPSDLGLQGPLPLFSHGSGQDPTYLFPPAAQAPPEVTSVENPNSKKDPRPLGWGSIAGHFGPLAKRIEDRNSRPSTRIMPQVNYLLPALFLRCPGPGWYGFGLGPPSSSTLPNPERKG